MNNYNFEILSKDEIVDIFGLTIPNNILPNLKIPCLKFSVYLKFRHGKLIKSSSELLHYRQKKRLRMQTLIAEC